MEEGILTKGNLGTPRLWLHIAALPDITQGFWMKLQRKLKRYGYTRTTYSRDNGLMLFFDLKRINRRMIKAIMQQHGITVRI